MIYVVKLIQSRHNLLKALTCKILDLQLEFKHSAVCQCQYQQLSSLYLCSMFACRKAKTNKINKTQTSLNCHMPLLPPTFSCACKRTGTGNHPLANRLPHPALLPAGERSKLRDKSQTAGGKNCHV